MRLWTIRSYVGSILMLVACGGTPAWTEEEIANFEHFHASMAASQQAVRISNQGGPGVMSAAEVNQRRESLRTALQEARLVKDDVMEKGLQGMSLPFRQKYQRGLELQLRSMELGSAMAAVEGSDLTNEWINWINLRSSEARFPRRR